MLDQLGGVESRRWGVTLRFPRGIMTPPPKMTQGGNGPPA